MKSLSYSPVNGENMRNEGDKKQIEATAPMNDESRLKTDLEREAYIVLKKYERTTMGEFGYLFNLKGREVRKLIEGMRRKGIRIGSDSKGYYLCNSEKEFKEFLNSYTAHAMSILETAKCMKDNNNEQIYIR